ncbi:hypothetical protein C2845_PM13G23550 [Panicum miliaceum]|uniref:Uncharacterized protein n=1 Tax=Panicum miliaceum TaxID=4540 RepID=A0A3L6RFE0_PANMI|nr:hypothetical protein C2845_PM13G23550 [Panicum miliaceum]
MDGCRRLAVGDRPALLTSPLLAEEVRRRTPTAARGTWTRTAGGVLTAGLMVAFHHAVLLMVRAGGRPLPHGCVTAPHRLLATAARVALDRSSGDPLLDSFEVTRSDPPLPDLGSARRDKDPMLHEFHVVFACSTALSFSPGTGLEQSPAHSPEYVPSSSYWAGPSPTVGPDDMRQRVDLSPPSSPEDVLLDGPEAAEAGEKTAIQSSTDGLVQPYFTVTHSVSSPCQRLKF